MNSIAALDVLYNKQQPFVAYRLPQENKISVIVQLDDTLHFTKEFNENGFVFAPYDSDKKAIIFPEQQSQSFSIIIKASDATIDSFEIEQLNHDQQHVDLVRIAINRIKTSNLEKVVLSRIQTKVLKSIEIADILNQLVHRYKNACCYSWYHPKVGLWFGATPERLLTLNNFELETMSLAGTLPNRPNSIQTWSSKELNEQQIVTDYIANALKEFAIGIEVSNSETISAGTLLHLRSKIKAIIHGNTDLKDVINKLHPTPAVCGMPKNEAQKFIDNHEGYDREFYTGFLGTISDNGAAANLFVNLRCMQIKGNTAQLYVGGGITLDSFPEKELEETIKKAETLLKVLK